MLKRILIMFLLFSCYLCLENNDVSVEDARAKKKKGSAKLLGLILLFAISKIAIFKTVSVILMMKFFQKVFTIGGILLKYFLNSSSGKPAAVYGAPSHDAVGYSQGAGYDTVGYSHGEHEPHFQGYPGVSDIATSFDWLVNKHV